MNPDATDQQHSSPTPSPSHPPLQKRASIRDEILMTVVSCLMHRRNCQIPNCPCRSLQDRFRELFHQNPSYVPHKHAAETCKRECGPNADPRERKHQLHLTLSSQNLTKEAHPHYHLTNRSHIRHVTKPPLQRQRSKSCDLTPQYEVIPEFPQTAAGSPEDNGFNSDPTYEQCKPPLFLREISISAENIPALCLNDCPLTPTPLREGRTLASSPMRLRPRRWSMPKTTLKTVKENSQSTESSESNESNTSSRSSGLEKVGSVSDGELQPAAAKQKSSGSLASSRHSERGRSASPHHHPSGSKQGSLNPTQVASNSIPIPSSSPVPQNPTAFKKEEPVLPKPSFENQGDKRRSDKRGRSVSPVPSNLSAYSMGDPVSLNQSYMNPSGHKKGRSTSPAPLQPNGYMMRGAHSPVPLSTVGYRGEEPVPSHPSFINPSTSKERSVSPVSLSSSIENSKYYNGYGVKRGQSASPVPSHPSGYKRGESGYESTAETVQSTPPTHTRNESGYESDGHSNPNSGSLARRARELKLQRQGEIDVPSRKIVTETLL